jgi:hypothetical protein
VHELRKDINVTLSKRYGRTIPAEKELSKQQNYLKNAVKHFNEPDSKHLIVEVFKINARDFISRAITNYCILNGDYPEGEIYKKIFTSVIFN